MYVDQRINLYLENTNTKELRQGSNDPVCLFVVVLGCFVFWVGVCFV